MKKVSIILPVYNCVTYLPVCLDSIISQTYHNIEIICINDGSTDGSDNVLNEYSLKDKRLVIVHQENSGVSEARNKALKIVTGEYVMFVDSDDWIDSDTVEKVLQYSICNNLDICSFSYISEYETIHSKKSLYNESKVFDFNATQAIARRIIGPIDKELRLPLMLDSYGTIWGKMYKYSIINGLKFESLKIIGSAEDSLFNMFAYRKAQKTGYLHNFFYHYRKTNIGSETKKFRPWLKDRWKIQYKIIRNAFPDEESQIALKNRIAINHYGLTANLIMSDIPRKMIRDVYNDSIFKDARLSLQTKQMSLIWRIFFNLIKHESITLVIIYHKLFSLIFRILK
mgnify:CR=1 FL=1